MQSKHPITNCRPNMGFSAFALLVFIFSSITLSTSDTLHQNFPQCLSQYSNTSNQITYSPNNSSYSSILDFSIQNLRFLSSATTKPQYIITPLEELHIQAAVICSEKLGLQARVRSGGHDYEGLSYTSEKPFVIIDLINFRKITINTDDKTAWVQAGATLGELYYHIAEKSNMYGFPAGICPTIGVGGHISGGGIGTITRKYGLSSDNILDAYVVDVKGRLLDRKSMGEDLFWAIRGGGGASFGVIVSWKIQLVPVPQTVTGFTVMKTLEQNATALVSKWQSIADKMDNDLFMRLIIQAVSANGVTTVQVIFQSLFLGRVQQLLPLVKSNFPELALEEKDCTEMSWVKSILYFNSLPTGNLSVLLNRTQQSNRYFKAKSDFVKKPISKSELESIWKVVIQEEKPIMILEPFGGRMSEISESATPFPHRAGNMYNIQYYMQWQEGGRSASEKYIKSVTRVYNAMGPYVSKSPRASYLNYRDLALGVNKDASTSYSKASVWGKCYFKGNFRRLALVKNMVDPGNFFWNEQSIPPLSL